MYTLGIFSGAGAKYHNHCLGTPRRPELHPPQCTILATLSHTVSRALMRTTVLVCGGPAMSPFWSFFGFGGIAASSLFTSARRRTSGRRDLLLPFAVHFASVAYSDWKRVASLGYFFVKELATSKAESDAHLLDELLYLVAVDCPRVVGVVHAEKHSKLRLVDGHGLIHDDCLEFLKVHSARGLGQHIDRPRGCLVRAQHLGNPEQGGAPVAPMGEDHRKCYAAHRAVVAILKRCIGKVCKDLPLKYDLENQLADTVERHRLILEEHKDVLPHERQ
eukprot:scaffold92730_cov66-Phaeocystis_antarctica.AAC.2